MLVAHEFSCPLLQIPLLAITDNCLPMCSQLFPGLEEEERSPLSFGRGCPKALHHAPWGDYTKYTFVTGPMKTMISFMLLLNLSKNSIIKKTEINLPVALQADISN